MLAIPPFWASSKKALLRANTKPPVELVVADLEGWESLIAIELKIGKFEAEYVRKIQMYLTALVEHAKLPDENLSIDIIICKSKEKTYVHYALKNINVPIGVATYYD